MRYCTNCGTKVETNFCPNCGMKKVETKEQDSYEKYKKFLSKAMMFLAIFLLLYGISRLRMYADYSKISSMRGKGYFIQGSTLEKYIMYEQMNLSLSSIMIDFIIPGLFILIGSFINNNKENSSYLLSGILYVIGGVFITIAYSNNPMLVIIYYIFAISNILIYCSLKQKKLTI